MTTWATPEPRPWWEVAPWDDPVRTHVQEVARLAAEAWAMRLAWWGCCADPFSGERFRAYEAAFIRAARAENPIRWGPVEAINDAFGVTPTKGATPVSALLAGWLMRAGIDPDQIAPATPDDVDSALAPPEVPS